MSHLRVIRLAIIAMGLVLTTFAANADKLDLSEGTMTTSGIAAFTVGSDVDPVTFNNVPGSRIRWDIDLSFGYFIIDNLSLDLDISTGGNFASPVLANVGFGLGAHYYFNLGSMINPYVAVMPGFEWENPLNVSLWSFHLPISAGLLIGLNSHVALDVGARFNLTWFISTGAPSDTFWNLTVGYVGVRAFF